MRRGWIYKLFHVALWLPFILISIVLLWSIVAGRVRLGPPRVGMQRWAVDPAMLVYETTFAPGSTPRWTSIDLWFVSSTTYAHAVALGITSPAPITGICTVYLDRLALVVLLGPLVSTLLRIRDARRRKRLSMMCPECGYDLRATPLRCPECGYVVPAAAGNAVTNEASQSPADR